MTLWRTCQNFLSWPRYFFHFSEKILFVYLVMQLIVADLQIYTRRLLETTRAGLLMNVNLARENTHLAYIRMHDMAPHFRVQDWNHGRHRPHTYIAHRIASGFGCRWQCINEVLLCTYVKIISIFLWINMLHIYDAPLVNVSISFLMISATRKPMCRRIIPTSIICRFFPVNGISC
jgi:hypothetical protein